MVACVAGGIASALGCSKKDGTPMVKGCSGNARQGEIIVFEKLGQGLKLSVDYRLTRMTVHFDRTIGIDPRVWIDGHLKTVSTKCFHSATSQLTDGTPP
eukprot:scaffold1089_cov117-Cylindrotheca_fusiformis.AAC.13